jgi:ABC-type multidrug transport system ATPase subunit
VFRVLTLCDIRKSFGDKTVLDGASLSVKRGEIAVISGVSGGGKTTLMRIAAGLETAESFRNNAAYVQNWLQVLKSDKRFIVSASGKAEKAVALILGSAG